MTEPLWGVGSTGPYGHDGRSINLREVILRHGGEAMASRNAFARLPEAAKGASPSSSVRWCCSRRTIRRRTWIRAIRARPAIRSAGMAASS
ncbi:MAG: hypothetical protein HC872_01280 [Gammaproteobacteria bacterium]|nr:hypothetical protein [Gammaproteobacteria bacterium]